MDRIVTVEQWIYFQRPTQTLIVILYSVRASSWEGTIVVVLWLLIRSPISDTMALCLWWWEPHVWAVPLLGWFPAASRETKSPLHKAGIKSRYAELMVPVLLEWGSITWLLLDNFSGWRWKYWFVATGSASKDIIVPCTIFLAIAISRQWRPILVSWFSSNGPSRPDSSWYHHIVGRIQLHIMASKRPCWSMGFGIPWLIMDASDVMAKAKVMGKRTPLGRPRTICYGSDM